MKESNYPALAKLDELNKAKATGNLDEFPTVKAVLEASDEGKLYF